MPRAAAWGPYALAGLPQGFQNKGEWSMKPTWLSVTTLTLLCIAQPTWGVDLTKIERALAKQPVYQTKTPRYCLLVFGAEAKMRVWLVLDGNVLYVDRNGDGDLTGAAKRVELNPNRQVFEVGPVSLADGKVHYAISLVRVKDKGRVEIYMDRKVALPHRKDPSEQNTLMEMAGLTSISFRKWMNRDNIEEFDFRFADRPQDAPIVHMDGPLTLKPMDKRQEFVRGETPSRFPVMVGTPGLGKGTFTQLLFVPGDPDGVAEIAFPPRDADSNPIVVKVTLKSPT
jgi:hypothetical protein